MIIIMIIITYNHITIGATISCHWANGDPSNPTVPFTAKMIMITLIMIILKMIIFLSSSNPTVPFAEKLIMITIIILIFSSDRSSLRDDVPLEVRRPDFELSLSPTKLA